MTPFRVRVSLLFAILLACIAYAACDHRKSTIEKDERLCRQSDLLICAEWTWFDCALENPARYEYSPGGNRARWDGLDGIAARDTAFNGWRLNLEHAFYPYGPDPYHDFGLVDAVMAFDQEEGSLDYLCRRLLTNPKDNDEVVAVAEMLAFAKGRLGNLPTPAAPHAQQLLDAARAGLFCDAEREYPDGQIYRRISWTCGAVLVDRRPPAWRKSAAIVSAAAASLALIAWPLFRWREKRKRLRAGACLHCSYDLRASRERCPECSTPIPPPKAPKSPETDPPPEPSP